MTLMLAGMMTRPTRPTSTFVNCAAALTAGAGLVHAAAAGTHAGDTTLVWLFATTAVAQTAVAAVMLARPERRLVLASAVLNLAIAGGWLASRTVGLPLIDSLAEPEAAGLQDVMATVLEVMAIASAAVALRNRDAAHRRALSALPALVALPVLIGMAAPHAHGSGHVHGDSEAASHTHAHDEEHDGEGHQVAVGLAADPIFSGSDTSHVSDAELQASKDLIETTRASVNEQFSDEASVVAAGYRSIGDGRRAGGFEHFVNPAYTVDGRELDPERIESLVFENTGDGKRLVSAMYILDRGKTMDDVPSVGGELTTWHDHQNLCWDATGGKLAGVLVNGRCVPGGTLRESSPMLHVWIEDHECGPFAGIEGHGAGCSSEHTH
jgi:hypothetical protein